MEINNWFYFGFGVVAAIVVMSLVLPDRWSTWLATRRNLPVVLLPLGVIALIIGLGNLFVVFGWAVVQALKETSVSSWVWWLTLAGVVMIVLFFITRRWHGFSFHCRQQNQNPQGGG